MDTKDYDMIRNQTLLFFLDHLMTKGHARTLHDLSCQFGTKGFSREMRQIAGGSQSGLRKFLSGYPSLFTLDGDYVTFTSYTNGVTNPDDPTSKLAGKRDYQMEAVEYFRNKILQYGPGTEVPIKSLLGHRSQASPEVRHISGQHVKEFKEFLMRTDAFIVKDEVIILKEHEDLEPKPFTEPEEVKIDPEMTNKLTEFFKFMIERKGPMTLDQLVDCLEGNFSRETWTLFFKTPQDLSTFLKMYSNIFLVQSHVVSLVPRKANCQQIQPQRQTNEKPSSPVHNNHTLKQRFNSVIMKTVQENAEKEKNSYNYNNFSNGVTPTSDLTVFKMLKSIRPVTNVKDSRTIVSELMRQNPAIVSLDGEGVNLGPNGPITLIQIGTAAGVVFIFDIFVNRDLMTEGNLRDLLESEHVLKVIKINKY